MNIGRFVSDIEQFQEDLNGDQSLRKSFSKDPVALLREKGIELPKEAEQQLAVAIQQGALDKPGTQLCLCIKIKF